MGHTRWALYLIGALALTVAFALSGGCKKPKKLVITKDQQRSIHESILTETPSIATPIGATFGDKVKLLGIDGPSAPLRPGSRATITYYWECLAPVTGSWKVFGHLEQPGKRQILDHHPVRNLYPINKWEKGQIVVDKQHFDVDKKFKSGSAKLWIGIFNETAWSERQANERLEVVDAGTGKTDKDDRLKVLSLKVTASKKTPTRSGARYVVRAPKTPIAIDGALDEPAWQSAPKTRVFLQPDGKTGNEALATSARLLADDEKLYVAFEVSDGNIASTFTERDDTLWKQDVVEIFLDPGNDGDDYVEIQVSPANVVFDAVFTHHRKPAWQQAAKAATYAIESAVVVDGTLNEKTDVDRSWTVELAIPFASIPGVDGRPAPGTRWNANLYRIDGDGPRNMSYQRTWAPVGGDFHKLDDAGNLIFPRAQKAASQQKESQPNVKPIQEKSGDKTGTTTSEK